MNRLLWFAVVWLVVACSPRAEVESTSFDDVQSDGGTLSDTGESDGEVDATDDVSPEVDDASDDAILPGDTVPEDADVDDSGDDPGEPDVDANDVTSDTGLPELPCDVGFDWTPDPGRVRSPFVASYANPAGYAYVGLELSGASNVRAEFAGHDGSGAQNVWTFRVDAGLVVGRYTMTFQTNVGHPDGTPIEDIAACDFWVIEGSGGDVGVPNDTGCTPSCAGVICGGSDGCGGFCTGGRRATLGASSDCRGNGDCGCGVRGQADNMQCTGDGRCRVRCECDCLPGGSSLIDAADVVGMDFSASCALALERSGDPTVWDYTNGVPLCPTGDLPDDANNCDVCPPCHRLEPPNCSLEAYCACVDPAYRENFSSYDVCP